MRRRNAAPNRREWIQERADELAGDPAVHAAVRALNCYWACWRADEAKIGPGSSAAQCQQNMAEALPKVKDKELRDAISQEFSRIVNECAEEEARERAWWAQHQAAQNVVPLRSHRAPEF